MANALHVMCLSILLIALTTLMPLAQTQFNWGTGADHHTSGTILQAQGGAAQRTDGQTQHYAHSNAFNNPGAWPRYPAFQSFGKRR